MSDYTRVTIVGSRQKADLVLPDDEPITALLPDVLDLLDENEKGAAARPVALSTTIGEHLDASESLADQDVRHGTVLRMVRVDAAPPPPDVADVTDVVGEATSTRIDTWHRRWGVAAAAVVAAVLAGYAVTVIDTLGPLVPLVLTLAGVLIARRGLRASAVVLVGAAVGGVLAPAMTLAEQGPAEGPLAVFLVWFALVGVIAALAWTLGFGGRAAGAGALTGPFLVLVWVVAVPLGASPAAAAAVATILGAAVLGLLPGMAMSLSGLSGIDDRVVEGDRVPRAETSVTVHAAHRALTTATTSTVVVIAALAWLLTDTDLWGRLIAVLVALLLLLRTRVLPLAPQRLSLIAGGTAPLLVLAVDWARSAPTPTGAATLLTGALLLALVVGWAPPAHMAARLRRAAGVLELLVILPLVPLLLASLGVFGDLIGTF